MPTSTLVGPPLLLPADATLSACLERAAADAGFVWMTFRLGKQVTPLTARAALAASRHWAAALERWVQPGDRVAICLPNGPEFVGALFGAFRLGAVAVPLPWPIAEPDPARLLDATLPQLNKSGARVLVTTPNVAAGAAWPLPTLTQPAEDAHGGAAACLPQSPAFMQFTSGSTGNPRGAVITHRAAVGCASAMVQALGLSQRDVGVSWLPFFHDMGLVGVLLTSLVARFGVHCLRPGEFLLRPRRWLELLSETSATLTAGPNFGYALLVRRVTELGGLDLSHLRYALNGSEPVHRSTLDALARKLAPVGLQPGVQRPVYGLAEASLGVSFTSSPEERPDVDVAGRSVPAVGTALPGVEIEVRDEQGHLVGAGVQGRVWVRGPGLMQGYFDDPAATAAALHDGWLDTGDLGVVQAGALYVTGREKELIVKAGQKFHPYDIECVVSECLDSTPNGVAAFSVPDAAQGTEALWVVAELRRQGDGVALTEMVRARLVDALGVRADHIELVAAGALPRTTSGKLRREAVRRAWGAP